MSSRAPRRGTLAALAVAVALVVLYVSLQPGERPEQPVAAATTAPPTTAPTTTLDPIVELCTLAREFVQSAQGHDVATTARLAEAFYDRARLVAPAPARPEYEAAVRYYTEYNDIGSSYGYDLFAALASPDGRRWEHLTFVEPLGVPAARADVATLCQVDLPPPPTITTTTTTTTTAPPRTMTSAAPETTQPETPAAPRDDEWHDDGRDDRDRDDDRDDERGPGNGRDRGRGNDRD